MLDKLALAYSKSEHEDPIKVIAHKIDRWTIVVTSMFFADHHLDGVRGGGGGGGAAGGKQKNLKQHGLDFYFSSHYLFSNTFLLAWAGSCLHIHYSAS